MRRYELLVGSALFVMAGAVSADGIDETNYLHIDPATATTVAGVFTAKNLRYSSYRSGVALIGRGFKIELECQVVIDPDVIAGDTDIIVLRFDEDICVIGMEVRITPLGRRNSDKVVFSFFASDASVVDREIRFPAPGTILQSFSSINFSDRFRGIEFAANARSGLKIGGIQALPCAPMTS